MTTKIIECFEVLRWDGGERQNHLCYMERKEDADALAGKHDAVIKKTFVVHDSVESFKRLESGELKKKALAKLTKEERLALGFNE